MEINQQSIISGKMSNGVKYLHSVPDEDLGSPDFIPEHIRRSLTPWVRDIRVKHDELTTLMDSSDKASDEYNQAARDREKLANSLMMAKSQVTEHNKGTAEMKLAMGSINKGTQDANLYTNTVIFGGQSDGVGFSDEGKMSFGSIHGEGEENVSMFKFDDHKSPLSGASPIITDPVGSKGYIWKLAEKTKQDAVGGKPFDDKWTYTSVFNNLTESGPQNTIGMAFADIAGDNQTKSFAEQYEDGLADPEYYIHPETGEQMEPESGWMKDPANMGMLNTFLGKYITNVMKSVHGPAPSDNIESTPEKTVEDYLKEIE